MKNVEEVRLATLGKLLGLEDNEVFNKMAMYHTDKLAILMYLVFVDPQDDELLELIKLGGMNDIPTKATIQKLKEFYETHDRDPDFK